MRSLLKRALITSNGTRCGFFAAYLSRSCRRRIIAASTTAMPKNPLATKIAAVSMGIAPSSLWQPLTGFPAT